MEAIKKLSLQFEIIFTNNTFGKLLSCDRELNQNIM